MGIFDFLFGSKDQEENDNPITIDVKEYSWTPDPNEQILVAHEECQILTNGGRETASFQYFICCVTNKRVVLVPMTKKTNKNAIKIVGSLLGTPFGVTRCLTKEFCEKYVDYPIYMDKEDITKIEIYTEIPSGKIVLIETKNFDVLLGTRNVGYSMDIQMSFYKPNWFTKS